MTEIETVEVTCEHHDHALVLRNWNKPYKCDGCRTESSGLRYRCETCNFDLHEECTFTNHEETSYHEFFPGSKLRFFRTPPKHCRRYCDGCGKAVDGFGYHCEKRGWDLHPRCLGLKKTLAVVDVEFRLRDKVKGKCIWCRKRKLTGSFSKVRGWSYVSVCGEYHFHVHCATDMVLDTWKKEAKNSFRQGRDGACCCQLEDRGGGGDKLLRIVRVFLKTFACIFFGDPTLIIASLLT